MDLRSTSLIFTVTLDRLFYVMVNDCPAGARNRRRASVKYEETRPASKQTPGPKILMNNMEKCSERPYYITPSYLPVQKGYIQIIFFSK